VNDDYSYDYDDPEDDGPREYRPAVRTWADWEAWQAINSAIKDWKYRQAPSVGARARAIINLMLYPPSYLRQCEEALTLFLSDKQLSERPGFWEPRPSNVPAVRQRGPQHYG
jgi:hypothetical protein